MDDPVVLAAIAGVLLLVVVGGVFFVRSRSSNSEDNATAAPFEPDPPMETAPTPNPAVEQSSSMSSAPDSPPVQTPTPSSPELPTFKNHDLSNEDPPQPEPEPTPALFDAPLFPDGNLPESSDDEGDPTLAMNSAELFSALSNPAVNAVPSNPISAISPSNPTPAVPSLPNVPSTFSHEEDEGEATQALDTMTLQNALARSLGGVKESLSSTTIKTRDSSTGPKPSSPVRKRLSSLPSNQTSGTSASSWSIGGQSGMHQLPSTMDSGFGMPSPSNAAISIASPPSAAESSSNNDLQDRLAMLRKQLNTFDQGGNKQEAISALVDEKNYKSSLRPGGTAFDMPTRRVSGEEIDAAVSSSASVEDAPAGQPPRKHGTMLGMPGVGAQDLKALSRQTFDALKAAPSIHGQPRAPFSEAIGSMQPDAINQLWVEYVEANHNVGRDVSRLKPRVFFNHLSQNHNAICQKYQCTRVKFGIKTSGNKVSLQAVPVRG